MAANFHYAIQINILYAALSLNPGIQVEGKGSLCMACRLDADPVGGRGGIADFFVFVASIRLFSVGGPLLAPTVSGGSWSYCLLALFFSSGLTAVTFILASG